MAAARMAAGEPNDRRIDIEQSFEARIRFSLSCDNGTRVPNGGGLFAQALWLCNGSWADFFVVRSNLRGLTMFGPAPISPESSPALFFMPFCPKNALFRR